MQTRDPYECWPDRNCLGHDFLAMHVRKFNAVLDAYLVSSGSGPADDDDVRMANDAVAAGIVFG